MAKINLLDKQTAELIAAGEVVERPSSVIKELVENSIDAEAGAITVEIKNGGNSFIRVTDDGCGIDEEDIPTAFLRHATSKISTGEDLDSIYTLGFRGEALASVCAVARVELLTRTRDSDFGNKYIICGGQQQSFEQAGCAVGTTIVVRDLFYNTPARLKFLKKDTTEANVVAAVMEHAALSHPEISFKLIRDGRQIMNTPGDGRLRSAIFSVYKQEFTDGLLPVDYEMNGVRVTGFCCKPTASRRNRAMQLFFINSRYVRTKTAVAALEQAYKNSITVGSYPACVLNLAISPSEVDVNVHPAKTEVRFSDEQKIFSAVYYAIKSTITADVSHLEVAPRRGITTPSEPSYEQTRIAPPSPPAPPLPVYEKSESTRLSEPSIPTYAVKLPSVDIVYEAPALAPAPPVEQKKADKPPRRTEFKYIGQAFSTYIIVQTEDDKLYIIDKHAAHERILFESIKANADARPQLLMTPINVRLAAAEYNALTENLDSINAAGFELEDYGVNSVLIRGVPMELDGEDASELVAEMAGKLIGKSRDFTPEFQDWLYHSVACRAAIKAGNRSTEPELSQLADRALNDPAIRYCPHGRPVCIELSRAELERRFLRS